MSDKQSDGHGNLTYYIIGAIVAAIGAGFFIPEIAVKFKVGGEVFLSLLMMMVVFRHFSTLLNIPKRPSYFISVYEFSF